MNAHRALGRYGEDVAARYLVDTGLEVLDRNWRCQDGEVDIVARDAETLVICEVKTRSGTSYQHPAAAVDGAKAARLRHLAHRWVTECWPAVLRAGRQPTAPTQPPGGRPPGGADRAPVPFPSGGVRIDLLAVLRGRRGPAEVQHLKGVA